MHWRAYSARMRSVMMLHFYKMTGNSHDFVMLDNRDLSLSHILTRANIADICQRRSGVGADGVIAVEPALGDADVRMRYYNADGDETKMSPDAACCFTAFVDFLMESGMKEVRFETSTGTAEGTVNEDDSITLRIDTPEETVHSGIALIVYCGQMILLCGDECDCGCSE